MAVGPALAQCGGCRGAEGCGSSQALSLKLAATGGDTFDVGRMIGRHPLVLLLAGTDKTSRAAAIAVQKAFAYDHGQPAEFFGVINAGMRAAKSAARGWKLGYTVLADPDKKVMSLLKAGDTPLVAFVRADGRVASTRSDITTASVLEGMKTLAQLEPKFVDPVCGMTVTKETAAAKSDYQGKTYYFCNAACKESFAKDPQKYLAQ